MAEQQTLTNAWIGYGLGQHIEEVRRRQAQVTSLLPWLIAAMLALLWLGRAQRLSRAPHRPPQVD